MAAGGDIGSFCPSSQKQQNTETAAGGEVTMPTFKTFLSSLKPRYGWKDGVIGSKAILISQHESSEAWMSLFLDLIYVCLFSKLSHVLSECEVSGTVLQFCAAITFVIFWSRTSISEYCTRFYQNDVFHRVLYLIYSAGIVVMVMNVDLEKEYAVMQDASSEGRAECTINETYISGFLWGFVIARMSILMLYVGIMVPDKSWKIYQQFQLKVWLWLISCAVSIVAALVDLDGTQINAVLLLICAIDLTASTFIAIIAKFKMFGYCTCMSTNYFFPVNYLEAQDRFGEFFIIILGESMLTLLLPTWDTSASVSVYIVNIAGLVLLFAFAMQYFDKCHREEGEMHAMRRGMLVGVHFVNAHAVIAFSMIITAQGIIDVADSARNGNVESSPQGALLPPIPLAPSPPPHTAGY